MGDIKHAGIFFLKFVYSRDVLRQYTSYKVYCLQDVTPRSPVNFTDVSWAPFSSETSINICQTTRFDIS
jgi:hypothetical protein